MFKKFAIAALSNALFLASPAPAQVVGEWQYQAFDFPSSIRITRDPADPRKMTGVGDLGGHLVVFTGTFVNLTWHGSWFWWGDGAAPPPGIFGCRYKSYAPVGVPGPSSRTATYGAFEFRFNAAENKLDGWWATKCRNTAANARVPGKVAFSANRLATLVAATPSVPYRPAAPRGSGGTALDPVPRLVGERPFGDGPCSDQLSLRMSAQGRLSDPAVAFSSRYRLRPCMTSAGKWVQVDFLNPEGKRPIRLVLQGLRVNAGTSAGERQVLAVAPTGRTLQLGLRFVGEPRSGQVISRIGMPGGICAAPLWLVWLDFSDGTRSREPIGTVISACGVQLHPEMVPPRSPAPESPEPVTGVTPRT